MSTANVTIHASQFPERVRNDLLASLHRRAINPKFHYDSLKQTLKWLALHEAHSPARTDRNVLTIYDQAFLAIAKRIRGKRLHLIGLGCGGGQKDARLLQLLKQGGKRVSYTPSDVSVAMTLVAREAARPFLSKESCFPLVCDLATARDLPAVLANRHPAIITFFGMIPNFEPRDILPKLAGLVGKKDYLLFSANLAPGPDYAAGLRVILPQYDNRLTRDWLLTLLIDLGIELSDGRLDFSIKNGALGLKRVTATFHFLRTRQITVHRRRFRFRRGESIRLFFSYRYTPDRVARQLGRHGLRILDQWLSESGEEGVFLCQRGRDQ